MPRSVYMLAAGGAPSPLTFIRKQQSHEAFSSHSHMTYNDDLTGIISILNDGWVPHLVTDVYNNTYITIKYSFVSNCLPERCFV